MGAPMPDSSLAGNGDGSTGPASSSSKGLSVGAGLLGVCAASGCCCCCCHICWSVASSKEPRSGALAAAAASTGSLLATRWRLGASSKGTATAPCPGPSDKAACEEEGGEEPSLPWGKLVPFILDGGWLQGEGTTGVVSGASRPRVWLESEGLELASRPSMLPCCKASSAKRGCTLKRGCGLPWPCALSSLLTMMTACSYKNACWNKQSACSP